MSHSNLNIFAEIANGMAFQASDKVDSIANDGGVQEYLVKTGAMPLIIIDRVITTNSDEVIFQSFAGVTVSDDGDEIIPQNLNRMSTRPSTVQVFRDPTVTDEGIGSFPSYIPGSTGQGQTFNGGFNQQGLVRILPANTMFLLRSTNNGGAVVNIETSVIWVESPEV